MLCGNGDHSANGTSLEKLEEMQGVLCAEGFLRNRLDQQRYGAETLATTKKQD